MLTACGRTSPTPGVRLTPAGGVVAAPGATLTFPKGSLAREQVVAIRRAGPPPASSRIGEVNVSPSFTIT